MTLVKYNVDNKQKDFICIFVSSKKFAHFFILPRIACTNEDIFRDF